MGNRELGIGKEFYDRIIKGPKPLTLDMGSIQNCLTVALIFVKISPTQKHLSLIYIRLALF